MFNNILYQSKVSNMEWYALFVTIQFFSLFAAMSTTQASTTTLVDIGPCRMIQQGSCPDNDNVKFYLYTSLNPSEGKLVDLQHETTLSDFNSANPTKIIIHGSSNMSHPGLVQIREAYLSSGRYNIFVVDYAKLNVGPDFPCYAIAFNNAPHAAECISQLVHWLIKARSQDIHVIGYSLGGHVASLLANYLRPFRLGRITGLDPARPLYELQGADETLNISDALFVDVVHTNGFISASDCSHRRAPAYFAESITSEKGFWGFVCDGYIPSLFQLCQSIGTPVLMGEHVSHSSRGFIYVNTSSESPFALGH